MAGASNEIHPSRVAEYVIEGVLGKGGTSHVYVARHQGLDRRLALKVFRVSPESPASAVGRLRREARLLAKLDHENIVRCFDFGEDDGSFFLAMELVDGESLKELLDREGTLSEDEAVEITTAVALALAHAHSAGIVHRDVKPGNILLGRDGRVKLTDFGLARGSEDLELTVPGTMVGTPQYLSPEQARNPRRVDERTDLYSLGASLYHMLTGTPPHVGSTLAEVIGNIIFKRVDPPEKLRPDLSRALSRIVARLMAHQARLRYRNASQLMADLRILEKEPSQLPGISWEQSSASDGQRGRPTLVIWAALAVLVIGLSLIALFQSFEPEQEGPITSEGLPVVIQFGVQDLSSGRISVAEAWAQLAANPDDPRYMQLRQAVLAEAERRVGLIGIRAMSAARRAVGSGFLEDALDAFGREVESQVRGSLGQNLEELPAALTHLVEEEVAAVRRRVEEELVTATMNRVNESIEVDLDREFGEIMSLLGQRRYRDCLNRLDGNDTAAEATVSKLYAKGVKTVVPEARSPRASDGWIEDAARSYRGALTKIRGRINRTIDDARDHALRSVESFAVLEDGAPSPDEIRDRLVSRVTEALGADPAEFPGEPGPLAEAVEFRTRDLNRLVRAREDARQKSLEAGYLARFAELALSRDVAGIQSALADLQSVENLDDPWLSFLRLSFPKLGKLRAQALEALERLKGKKTSVLFRGIHRQGVLRQVDRDAGMLVFESPSFEVPIADLEAADLVNWAGLSAPPEGSALLLFFAGELDAALELAGRHEDEPWSRVIVAAVARQKAEMEQLREGRKSQAVAKLAAYDQAVQEGRTADVVAIAESLVHDPGLRRVDLVETRLRELQRAIDQGNRSIELASRRAVFRQRTGADVHFADDGTARLTYRFDRENELTDFKLPGPEWKLRDGWLSSVVGSDSGTSSPGDMYLNRPGVILGIPFATAHPIRLEFELELPYEQPVPGLFGVRLLSTCFVIRSFGPDSFAGQANAYSGDLDDALGYLFEPSIGQSRPQKKGAGNVREFSLERGNRYAVVVDYLPGPPAECTLTLEGDSVYKFRPQEKPRVFSLEIRSKTAIRINDLTISGTLAGRGWKVR